MEIAVVIELSLNTAAFPYLLLSLCLGEDTRCKDHKLNLPVSNSSSGRRSRLVLPAPSSSAPCLLHDLGVWTKWKCKSLSVSSLPLAWVSAHSVGDDVNIRLQGMGPKLLCCLDCMVSAEEDRSWLRRTVWQSPLSERYQVVSCQTCSLNYFKPFYSSVSC